MKRNIQIIDFSLIWKKIHDTLTEEEAAVLEDWLSANDEHRTFFERAQQFYSQGSGFDRTPIDSQAALQKVMGKTMLVSQKSRNYYLSYVASISAVLLFLALAYFIYDPFTPETKPFSDQVAQSIAPGTDKAILLLDDGTTYDLSAGQTLQMEEGGTQISILGTSLQYQVNKESTAEAKYNTLVIPRGGQYSITLADGTKVWLNAGTSLRYPTSFNGAERRVELAGEAYFEVTKDTTKPFRVVSGEQVVEVLGTSFNISSYQEDSSLYTTLVEGKVNVSLASNTHIQEVLLPSQQSIYVKGTKQILQRTVDLEEYVSWKEGWFYFKDKPLESITQTLARWYNVEVRFKNEAAKKLQFTGKVRRYEDLREILDLLEKTNEVKFEIERGSITVE